MYLVVDVTVGEHGVEVLHGLAGAPVVVVLQAFLDGAHVHGVLDHLVVVLQTQQSVSMAAETGCKCWRTHSQAELDGVHRLVEGPSKLVLPQRLHHHVLHVLQLVGLPEGREHAGLGRTLVGQATAVVSGPAWSGPADPGWPRVGGFPTCQACWGC